MCLCVFGCVLVFVCVCFVVCVCVFVCLLGCVVVGVVDSVLCRACCDGVVMMCLCVCVVLSSSNAAPPAAGSVCDGTVRAAMVIVAVIGGSKRIESLRPVNLSVQYVVNIVLRVAASFSIHDG